MLFLGQMIKQRKVVKRMHACAMRCVVVSGLHPNMCLPCDTPLWFPNKLFTAQCEFFSLGIPLKLS